MYRTWYPLSSGQGDGADRRLKRPRGEVGRVRRRQPKPRLPLYVSVECFNSSPAGEARTGGQASGDKASVLKSRGICRGGHANVSFVFLSSRGVVILERRAIFYEKYSTPLPLHGGRCPIESKLPLLVVPFHGCTLVPHSLILSLLSKISHYSFTLGHTNC